MCSKAMSLSLSGRFLLGLDPRLVAVAEGVAQGAMLSPVLFNMYTSDVPRKEVKILL